MAGLGLPFRFLTTSFFALLPSASGRCSGSDAGAPLPEAGE